MKFFFGAVGGIWIPLALVWCSQASEAPSQKSRFLAQDQLVGLQKKFSFTINKKLSHFY